MSASQKQGIWITNLGFDYAEIVSRVKQAWVPAFPVWQQFFNLFAEIHRANVYDTACRDNDADGGITIRIVISASCVQVEISLRAFCQSSSLQITALHRK